MVDFSLDTNNVVVSDDVNFILQEIDMLFCTSPKEVLGFEEYGTNYNSFLYNLNTSTDVIQQTIYQDIGTLELFGFVPAVSVYLLHGTQNDIILVDIVLTRGGERYEKTYKIIE